MRSKNKKRKSAYRRGERIVIFFKRGTIFLLVIAVIACVVLGIKLLKNAFRISEIVVSGTYHLDGKDIIARSEIKKGDRLVDIDADIVDQRLKKNPWITDVKLRKQFPDIFVIKVEEAVPRALLSEKKKLYLLDGDGRILESIKGEVTPFLPVIKDISPKNNKVISEAIKLVDILSQKNIVASKESIEIGLESYGLSMKIDGELIKVGFGNYSRKFDRWMELEPEIRKKGLLIKYVDLRFKDSVIVKPLTPVNRGSSS